MTETIIRQIPTGGARTLQISAVALDDRDLAPALLAPDPEAAAAARGETAWAAANAGVLAEARSRRAALEERRGPRRGLVAAYERLAAGFAGLYAKTPARPDPGFRMSWPERVTAFLYVLARFALLGVTIGLIASYVRASGYSVDLSESWPLALAFGFPVLLASYALSSLADGVDDLEAKRRIARRLTWAGALVLLVWAICTASIFKLDPDAGAGFAASLGGGSTLAPLGPVEAALAVVDALFPSQKTMGAILLFAHVVGDVLVSAALGAWSKLSGRIGRPTAFAPRADAVAAGAEAAAQAEALRPIESQLEHIDGLEAAYEAGRAALVEEARQRIRALALKVEAEQLSARAAAVETLRRSA